MTKTEYKELLNLLNKLKKSQPELSVLITDISEKKKDFLETCSIDYYCDLAVQIETCLNDDKNDNLIIN